MNQIDISDYQQYLDSNGIRMVRLTFLKKECMSLVNIDFRFFISKNSEILSGLGVVQNEQI